MHLTFQLQSMHSTVFCCTLLYFIVLCFTVYHCILFCIRLYNVASHGIVFCFVLHFIVWRRIVFVSYRIVLHCTVVSFYRKYRKLLCCNFCFTLYCNALHSMCIVLFNKPVLRCTGRYSSLTAVSPTTPSER